MSCKRLQIGKEKQIHSVSSLHIVAPSLYSSHFHCAEACDVYAEHTSFGVLGHLPSALNNPYNENKAPSSPPPWTARNIWQCAWIQILWAWERVALSPSINGVMRWGLIKEDTDFVNLHSSSKFQVKLVDLTQIINIFWSNETCIFNEEIIYQKENIDSIQDRRQRASAA